MDRKKGGTRGQDKWVLGYKNVVEGKLVTAVLQRVVMHKWSQGKILWKYNRNKKL